MFEFGWFLSHSKFQLPWKIECDSFTDEDWESFAKLINWKFAFGSVHGVPTGGDKLESACKHYCTEGYPPLIVDDVLTTGKSMIEMRDKVRKETGWETQTINGVVLFDRKMYTTRPLWIWPIFTVNDWSQSRATGLG